MKTKFTTNINKELLEELKIKAIKENKNVNEILEDLIGNYLGVKKMKNWNTNIVKSTEDNTIKLSFAGMDREEYKYLTLNEFIEEVENADTWDFIDAEIYEVAFKGVGLEFGEYDDAEEAWDAFLKTSKNYE